MSKARTLANLGGTDLATQAELDAATFDDNKIQTNIALLAFKTAVNGSLAKYDLQDQIVDEYTTNAGINTGDSTNEVLTAGVYAGVTASGYSATGGVTDGGVTVGDYKVHTFLLAQSSTAFTPASSFNVDYLVVAGGGGGGGWAGSGGGAGGFLTGTGLAVTATGYTITVGDGGTGTTAGNAASVGLQDGYDSVFFSKTSTGGGMGAGGSSFDGGSGGSGGGASYIGSVGVSTVSPNQGNDGGLGNSSSPYLGGGGGGAGAVGDASGSTGGVGGAGENNIMGLDNTLSDAILETVSVGVDSGSIRYLAGGGGGGTGNAGTGGVGGIGGGGNGGTSSVAATAGTANTGGGGGGARSASSSGTSHTGGGKGGSGVVIIRYLANLFTNLTLQSTDTAAEAVPTKADMVMLIEDTAGTATINTDIKGFVSRDSGSTFIEGTLVDEGDWGTDKRILAFHDLSFTGASGQAMCYKITTHNQTSSKETKIHATSIGWR